MLLGLILTACITILLLQASYEDMKQRTIGSLHVVVLYILVAFYTVITNTISMQTTFVFLFAFIIFMGIAVFSRGHFGIGDAMVIGALAWYFGNFMQLQFFLFSIGFISIPWWFLWAFKFRNDNTFKGLFTGFKKTLPIDKVRPGMVLATDNFMQGLTSKDIDRMRMDGYITVNVKFPYPFIPVIFMAFLSTLLHAL